MRLYHLQVTHCEIVHAGCLRTNASIHHVLPRGRGGDDVAENFVKLCGSGTTGLHGQVTENDPAALDALYDHIVLRRPEIIAYLNGKLGRERGADFLVRTYRRRRG